VFHHREVSRPDVTISVTFSSHLAIFWSAPGFDFGLDAPIGSFRLEGLLIHWLHEFFPICIGRGFAAASTWPHATGFPFHRGSMDRKA
jgi:hypothetical protein